MMTSITLLGSGRLKSQAIDRRRLSNRRNGMRYPTFALRPCPYLGTPSNMKLSSMLNGIGAGIGPMRICRYTLFNAQGSCSQDVTRLQVAEGTGLSATFHE